MSLITGTAWELAARKYLASAVPDGWTAEKQNPPGEHKGRGAKFSAAGPADIAIRRGDSLVAVVEVKAWTNGAPSWPLAKIKPSQAADMDAAPHAAVLLRWAGQATDDLTAALSPDLVFVLDWRKLGPLWHAAKDSPVRGDKSLLERECQHLAIPDGIRLRMDAHGNWTCPPVLPAMLDAWGLA